MPDRPEDVDEAFARLVAGYHDEPAPGSDERRWPEAEDVDPDAPRSTRWRRGREDAGDPDSAPDSAPSSASDSASGDDHDDALVGPAGAVRPEAGLDDDALDDWDDDEHFVPPDPPPLPRPAPIRLAAWLGVLVGPVLMMLMAGLGIRPPGLVMAALVAGFVGGVVYLIATMSDTPRDPYDDGSAV